MKKSGMIQKAILAVLLSATLLTGCGSTSQLTQMDSGNGAAASADLYGNKMALQSTGNTSSDNTTQVTDSAQVSEGTQAGNAGDGQSAATEVSEAAAETEESVDTSRKFIKTVDITAETKQFDDLMKKISAKTQQLKGYIESSNISTGSSYDMSNSTDSSDQLRSASLTIRIPADQLDGFVTEVTKEANVTSQSMNVDDVTLTYVDLESHKNALKTEESRLLELMKQATTTEDMISIEDKLADVRYQLESMESQLRTYDNQIRYSTVNLTIDEVEKTTPKAPKDTWGRIQTGFMEDLSRVLHGLQNVGIWILTHIPSLVVWAIVVVIVVVLIKKYHKGSGKRAQRRAEKERREAEKRAERRRKNAEKKNGIPAAEPTHTEVTDGPETGKDDADKGETGDNNGTK